MAKKKVLVALAIATGALLSGCATPLVPGLAIEQTTNFEDNRDSVVVEAYVTDSETGELKPGSVRFYQDQMPFDGNQAEFGESETFFKIIADNTDELAGHRLTVTVSSSNPDDRVFCAIKDTSIFEPVHSAEADGEGSATCQVEMH